MRRLGLIGALAVVGVGVTTAVARDASACGGCFHDPNEIDSVITDHRMILSVSTQQTTLYDQIEFSGAAASFAWVLPIKGVATVGLSADLLFSSLDQLTQSQVVPPPTNCPSPSCTNTLGFGASGGATAPSAGQDAATAGGVVVTEQQQVGPYETVQLHSTDPAALNNWLTAHSYAIPPAAAAVVSQYVSAGFDFLAMKLAPGQGVTAMRPVRVTTTGASAVLPLRMVSVGTGATTGITLWVVADGRYEPQNFPFFQINDSDLAWDWSTSSSNYETVRLSKEAALGGKGWQIESSLELNQYSLTSLVLNGGSSFGGPAPADTSYLPVGIPVDGGAAPDGGSVDAGSTADAAVETADQVRQDDLDTLFAGIAGPNARITRIRTDIAHAALATDLQLQASADQSEVSNIHNPTGQIGEPLCNVYNGSCEITGQVPRSQAAAANAAAGSSTTSSGTGTGTGIFGGVMGSSSPTTSGGGGCSTTDARSSGASGAGLAGFLGFLGFAVVRSRRRSKPAR
jgi:hypothetical protein